MRSSLTLVFAAIISFTSAGLAHAQEPRLHLAVKGGAVMEESEDATSGAAPALAVTASWPLTARWRLETEFWLPGYLEDEAGEPRHRDVLFSASALRTFGSGRVRPFLLGGYSLARIEDRLTLNQRHVSSGGYFVLGGGFEVALSRRVSAVADVRVSLAPASALVRPAAGISIGF